MIQIVLGLSAMYGFKLVFILKRLPYHFAESQSKMPILLCWQNQSLRRSILTVLPCTALVPIKNWRFWMGAN